MSDLNLMTVEEAKKSSFAELARNIRVNIETGNQSGVTVLQKQLLLELLDILEEKIGGRRPELPTPPSKPYHAAYGRLPPPNPTAAQSQEKRRLRQEIRAAKQALTSQDEQRRTKTKNQIEELRRQLANITFKIRISGLPAYLRKNWGLSREALREHEQKLAAYDAELIRYKQREANIRHEIEQWNSIHGSNPDYETYLRIADHLRADVAAYIRGDFVLRATKLPWRFLPPGSRDVSWIVDEIARLKSRYPDLRLDEERLRYAQSLKPAQVFVGEDEFDGYFAFVFTTTRHVLLENPEEGNAAYIFQLDWTSLSRRTKQELLSNYTHCVKRVLHRENSDWKWRIRNRLGL